MANNLWAPQFGIDEGELQSLVQKHGSAEAALRWSLNSGRIPEADYLDWAMAEFELPLVKSEFFEIATDTVLLDYLRNQYGKYNWSAQLVPLAEWDGVLLIGCLQPPTDFSFKGTHRFVLASPERLSALYAKLRPESKATQPQKVEVAAPAPQAPVAAAPTPAPEVTEIKLETSIGDFSGSNDAPDGFSFDAPEGIVLDSASGKKPAAESKVSQDTSHISFDAPEGLSFDAPEGLSLGADPATSLDIGLDLGGAKTPSTEISFEPAANAKADVPEGLSSTFAGDVDLNLGSDISAEDTATADIATDSASEDLASVAHVAADIASADTATAAPVVEFEMAPPPVAPAPASAKATAAPPPPPSPSMQAASEATMTAQSIVLEPPPPPSPAAQAKSDAHELRTAPPPPPPTSKVSTAAADLPEVATSAVVKQNEKTISFEETKSLDELGAAALGQVLRIYEYGMILLFQKNELKPWKWTELLLSVKGENPNKIDLATPSIFRIAHRTSLPYHGFVVPSPVNDAFLRDFFRSQLPKHVTLTPVLAGGQMVGMIMGITNGEINFKGSLREMEVLTSSFAKNYERLRGLAQKKSA